MFKWQWPDDEWRDETCEEDEEERHLALQQGSRQERWQVGGSLGIGGEALEEGRTTRSGELWENSLDQVDDRSSFRKKQNQDWSKFRPTERSCWRRQVKSPVPEQRASQS